MTRRTDPLLERLGEAVPPPTDAFEALVRRREHKTRAARWRAGIVGGALALVLIAALVLWSPITSRSTKDRPSGLASNGVPLVAAPGEFYYARVAGYGSAVSGSGPVTLNSQPTTQDLWYAPDGSGRALTTNPLVQELSNDERFQPGTLTLPELSTDPDTLIAQLIQRGSPSGASPNPIATSSPSRSQESTSLLRTLGDLFSMGDHALTPEQVAAAFEGAKGIDGVTEQSGVTDPLGRPADMLSFVISYYPGAGSRVEWYFEPDTHQWMGEIWVDQGTGDVTAATLVEMAGIASAIDHRPPLDARYVEEGTAKPNFMP